jgi:hypothetical protein
MILPRNRRVGRPGKRARDLERDRNGDRRRLNNPTSKPRLLSESQEDPKNLRFPDPMPKPRAEWIKGRKFKVTPYRPRGPGPPGRRQCRPANGRARLRLGPGPTPTADDGKNPKAIDRLPKSNATAQATAFARARIKTNAT